MVFYLVNMKITIYSTTTCPYCKMLKNYLTSKNVSFIEKLTDQDAATQQEMATLSEGFLGVPFTVFEKIDGTQEKVVGFDKAKIDSIVGII